MLSKVCLAARIALVLTMVAPLATAQNTNNANAPAGQYGGPGGGGPGGGGPGGRGGWGGGPGGPGGGMTPAGLILMPVIQEELKLTDKQKEQIKQINDDAEKQRTVVRDKAQKVMTAAREQAAQEAAAEAEANGVPLDPNANANNGGGRRNGGGRNGPGAQAMRQTLDEFQAKVEAALLKPLDAKQKTRIKQIALQAEGARAFDNPDVVEKLGMTEDQVGSVQAINNDSQQSGRQLRSQLFNNNNHGNGNNGNGGGRPDPATFQTPEFQAKIKGVQEGQKKLDDQAMAAVGNILTKAQRAKFQGMVGAKFDLAQLRQNMMNRFRPGGTPAPAPTIATATATASTATPTPAVTPAPATATATKPAARKSLRESRGGTNAP